jgi:hypothetical protein
VDEPFETKVASARMQRVGREQREVVMRLIVAMSGRESTEYLNHHLTGFGHQHLRVTERPGNHERPEHRVLLLPP